MGSHQPKEIGAFSLSNGAELLSLTQEDRRSDRRGANRFVWGETAYAERFVRTIKESCLGTTITSATIKA